MNETSDTASEARRASLFRDLLAGRRRLVVWGATGDARYALFQFPVRPVFLVDSDTAKWGMRVGGVEVVGPDRLAGEEPERTVVMLLPQAEDLRSLLETAVSRIGAFPLLPAFSVERDAGLLARAAEGIETPAAAAARDLGRPIEEALAAALRAGAPPPSGDANRVVLFTERLTLGGSERQICRLASGLARAGLASRLIVTSQRLPHTERLEQFLDAAGVPVDVLPPPRDDWTGPAVPPSAGQQSSALADVIRRVPVDLQHAILMSLRTLEQCRPGLVIAYMERAGVIAGLAALLAGVPRVLISLRSLDPTHFSQYFPYGTDWYAKTLALLANWPGVRMVANSAAGAQACARWMGLPAGTLGVIANTFPDAWEREEAHAAAPLLRTRLGIRTCAPLIAGVFRMVEEKQPHLFLEVLEALRTRHPDLRAVLVGDGPLRAALEASLPRRDLAGVVSFVGGQPDALPYMAAADLLLHTAAFEGMPNVHLEAQSLGRPVASFAVGGVLETMAPVLHPLAAPASDVSALVERVDALITDSIRREQLGADSRAWVEERFGMHRLIQACLDW